MGHSIVVLKLDVYSHLLPGMQQPAVEKLEKVSLARMNIAGTLTKFKQGGRLSGLPLCFVAEE